MSEAVAFGARGEGQRHDEGAGSGGHRESEGIEGLLRGLRISSGLIWISVALFDRLRSVSAG